MRFNSKQDFLTGSTENNMNIISLKRFNQLRFFLWIKVLEGI